MQVQGADVAKDDGFLIEAADFATGGAITLIRKGMDAMDWKTAAQRIEDATEQQWEEDQRRVFNEWSHFVEAWGGTPPTPADFRAVTLYARDAWMDAHDPRKRAYVRNFMVNAGRPDLMALGVTPRVGAMLREMLAAEIELLAIYASSALRSSETAPPRPDQIFPAHPLHHDMFKRLQQRGLLTSSYRGRDGWVHRPTHIVEATYPNAVWPEFDHSPNEVIIPDENRGGYIASAFGQVLNDFCKPPPSLEPTDPSSPPPS